MKVVYKPRLLSDNGASYIVSDLTDYLDGKGMDHIEGRPYHKHPGQNRTLVSVTEESDTAVKLLFAERSGTTYWPIYGLLQSR